MEGEKTMKKGVFYSVGVGPGDPELITLKAVRTLERCPVVAAPQTKNGEMLALSIAQQAVSLEGKTVVPLHFTMSRDKAQQHAAHLAAAQFVEQVEPEFVFHEDGDFWMRRVEEPARVARCVDRQVEDVIHALIVLADLVTRRREEREQDFVFGMFLAGLFDQGSALFEFAQGGGMYPDNASRGVDALFHAAEESFPAVDPEFRLSVPG